MVYFRLAMFPTLLAFAVGCITQSLPVVDLGYERHRALFLDVCTELQSTLMSY
jgi:hypothetical protein